MNEALLANNNQGFFQNAKAGSYGEYSQDKIETSNPYAERPIENDNAHAYVESGFINNEDNVPEANPLR